MNANLCPRPLWDAVRLATTTLNAEGINYVLIGSCALAARGLDVPVPDADLLVERDPDDSPGDVLPTSEGSGKSRLSTKIDGNKIDYVNLETAAWLTAFLSHPVLIIDGVRVASVADVIAIKKRANRKKDREQIASLEAMGVTA
jgi:hypothetical protein